MRLLIALAMWLAFGAVTALIAWLVLGVAALLGL
jgi:hypothetical protein